MYAEYRILTAPVRWETVASHVRTLIQPAALMHIRLAESADVPAILAISNWAAIHTPANFAVEPETLDTWQRSFAETREKYPWLVAVDANGGMTGFAKASPHKSRCAYAWSADVSVYVHPDHHRRGVGAALYGRLIPMLREQGFVTLIAGITVPNPASQSLHESCGFKRVGTYSKIGWKFGCEAVAHHS